MLWRRLQGVLYSSLCSDYRTCHPSIVLPCLAVLSPPLAHIPTTIIADKAFLAIVIVNVTSILFVKVPMVAWTTAAQ